MIDKIDLGNSYTAERVQDPDMPFGCKIWQVTLGSQGQIFDYGRADKNILETALQDALDRNLSGRQGFDSFCRRIIELEDEDNQANARKSEEPGPDKSATVSDHSVTQLYLFGPQP